MAAGLVSLRPHSVDPCGGDRAGHRPARRKILTASTGCFRGPHSGNTEAANGLASTPQALAETDRPVLAPRLGMSLIVEIFRQNLSFEGHCHFMYPSEGTVCLGER